MKVAIVGSRNFTDVRRVIETVDALPEGTVVVSGGARGVDMTAANAAKARGLDVIIFPAKWDSLGRGAGLMRNSLIAKECDEMIAFWDGHSRGTLDSITKARALGKVVTVHQYDPMGMSDP